ncbi:MAG: TonB-dependent receptor, partial [Candidatus Cloacimonetes bacterium]|nr:TonB-dependent receptor [Candidatus Cloacimonadota bacterium]
TNWNDQAKSVTVYDEDLDADVKVFMNGIDSRHMGVELQANAQPLPFAKFRATFSKGDWKYLNDIENARYELPGGGQDTLSIYVKDLKVGGQPQTQLVFGTTLLPLEGLKADLSYKYYMDFYSDWDPFSRQDPNDDTESWQVPDYGVANLHMFYKLPVLVEKMDVEVFAHIFNLFDEVYVQDATDNSQYNAWWGNGVDHKADDAEVFFGLPRRYNMGVSVKF